MKDKVVLVTGGSQGYGKSIAKILSKEGARVVIAARNEDNLKKALLETGCDSYLSMDVASYSDWENIACKQIIDKYGRLDVLVNNAGGAVSITDIENQTQENIDKIISLNLSSVIYGSQVFSGIMKKQKSGIIINIASACAKHAWPGWSVYAAAKWGVLGFSKNLYVDLQTHNIRVTCIIPGAGATDFGKHAGTENYDVKLQADDIGNAVMYVCKLPGHVVIEEMTIWGSDQAVVPL